MQQIRELVLETSVAYGNALRNGLSVQVAEGVRLKKLKDVLKKFEKLTPR